MEKLEIKFRGKCIISGKLIYGDLIHGVGYYKKDNLYILPRVQNLASIENCDPLDGVNIIPETVGQFTGLQDKNGVDIYEGDIVKWTNGSHYWEAVISTVKNNKSNTLYAVETFNNLSENEDGTKYTFIREDSRKGFRNELEFLSKTTEIIGNIHENPEILNPKP